MNNDNNTKRVVIGLSGGVDSSVAAILLKEKGYNVIGVTMKLLDKENDSAILDAKKVADSLGIEFHVLDLQNEFKKYVIDSFAHEYINGRTPNPCIVCNKYLKFGLLLTKSKELFNADYIATGHYARVEYNKDTYRYNVIESDSNGKDQTYVLYSLTQEQLKHTLMPLGDYKKEEIRRIAEKHNLITANKKDSQEICFVEDNDYAGFIKRNFNYTPKIGEFIDTKGNKYGKHKGIIHYTVGQRRGLGLSLKSPLYVKSLNPDNNEILLCSKEELESDSLILEDVNWQAIEKPTSPITAEVKIRYSAPKAMATLIPLEDGSVKVVFNDKQRAITPGQAAVFYKGNMLLGGGIIQK